VPLRIRPRPAKLVAALTVMVCAAVPASASATGYVVNSNADLGDKDLTVPACATTENTCTLRAAIQQSNANPGADQITFSIGSGAQKIAPTFPLPAIGEPIVLDATTQGGFAGIPLIELSGENLPADSFDGLVLRGGSSSVKGFVINRWRVGLALENGNLNAVTGNWIGTTADGLDGAGNTRSGIYVLHSDDNLIGGTTPGDKNVVSGNGNIDAITDDGDVGIEIFGSSDDNVVVGNFVGVDATGTNRIQNAEGGIFVGPCTCGGTPSGVSIGNGTEDGQNVIAGNRKDGVYVLNTPNAQIRGNVIGLGVTGQAVGPDGSSLFQEDGITIEAAPDATIGGSLAGQRNVISNSEKDGIEILGPNADRAQVYGNYLGTTLNGESFRDAGGNHTGNRRFGVIALGRTDNTPVGPQQAQIGGSAPGQGNVISGNAFGVGLAIESSGSKVQGNLIGTDKDGTDDLGNVNQGISVELSPNNDIGGTAAGEGNVVSANAVGVIVIGKTATGNKIEGNFVGTKRDGTSALGNDSHGITFAGGASSNVVGYDRTATPVAGCPVGECNRIMFNGFGGVTVQDDENNEAGDHTDRNTIRGNRIARNSQRGIDLITQPEPTANDSGDGDEGPNELRNFPVGLASYRDPETNVLTVSGVVDAPDPLTLTVDIYGGVLGGDANDDPDSTGFGEGYQYVTTIKGCKDPPGPWSDLDNCIAKDGSFQIKNPPGGANWYSATVTDANGNTSEFGQVCGDPDNNGTTDNDADSLCDDWETKGIDYDGDAQIDLPLHLAPYNANVNKKDVFVEVDWMSALFHSHRPVNGTLDDVVSAFNLAPGGGVTLHPMLDESVDEITPFFFLELGPDDNDDFFDIRDGAAGPQPAPDEPCDGTFGTETERSDPATCADRLGAKNLAFRYAMFVHDFQYKTGTPEVIQQGGSGVAEFGAGDFIVSLGDWSRDDLIRDGGGLENCLTATLCRRSVEAGTFMHELGHTLGLGHGGHSFQLNPTQSGLNNKPNFLSVMNYTYQFASIVPKRPLDYSRWALSSLIENQLLEANGIDNNAPQPGMGNWSVVWSHYNPATDTCDMQVKPAVGDIDWNLSGAIDPGHVGAGLNEPDRHPDAGDEDCQVPANRQETLQSHDDWTNLHFSARDRPGVLSFGAGQPPPTPFEDDPEQTPEDQNDLAAGTDFDGDGDANNQDNCPSTENPGQEDSDGDGLGDACEPPSVPGNSAPPAISGTARDGSTLTASTGTWSGAGPITFAYQWRRCDDGGAECADIPGATGSTYVLTSADVDHRLRVRVTATNSAGPASAESAPSGKVEPRPPAITGTPSITGTLQDGSTLTAVDGAWTGTTPLAFAYQWRRCDSGGGDCQSIPGATAKTYTQTPDDVGKRLKVRVTASNDAGSTGPVESPLTGVVGARLAVSTGAPTVTGTLRVGETLTASDGSWSGTPPFTFAYQWERCNGAGTACADIPGATSKTYVLTPADVGSRLRVRVAAANAAGAGVPALSSLTLAIIGIAPANVTPPALTGTAREGEVLTVDNGTWSGTPPLNFTYQWFSCPDFGVCTAITHSAQSLTLGAEHVGRRFVVTVTARNSGGMAGASTAPTALVVAASSGGGGGGGDGGSGGGGGGTGDDKTAPGLSLSLGRTLDLAATAKRGLSAVGTCSEACTVDAQLSIDKRTARKLGVASARVVIGRAKVSLAAGERKTIRVKVAKKARRKLARAKRVRVQLALVIRDAAGNATTMKRTVTLRRLRKARAGVDARAGAAGPSLLLPGGELSLGLVNPAIGLGAAARK
jgi:hypothetical protein